MKLISPTEMLLKQTRVVIALLTSCLVHACLVTTSYAGDLAVPELSKQSVQSSLADDISKSKSTTIYQTGGMLNKSSELASYSGIARENYASISQQGNQLYFSLTQSGYRNDVSATQNGYAHFSNLSQAGEFNSISLHQSGKTNQAFVDQQGVANSARVEQYGQGGFAQITQIGAGNKAIAIQY